MKKIKMWQPIAAVLLGLSASVVASYPAIKMIQSDRSIERKEVLDLDAALREALVKRDIPALQELLADDFELYTINQGVLSKGEWIRNIQKGGMSYTTFAASNLPRFEGHQMRNTMEVSGEFWGVEAVNYPIELSIRTVERKDKRQIKCMVVKRA